MEGPVQRLLARWRGGDSGSRGQQLAPRRNLPPTTMSSPRLGARQPQPRMKNAALVYGFGALLLYGVSFMNLASAEWFNGLVLLVPATSLAYLAYRYLVQEE